MQLVDKNVFRKAWSKEEKAADPLPGPATGRRAEKEIAASSSLLIYRVPALEATARGLVEI